MSDEKWSKIEPLLSAKRTGRGRPRADDREVPEGILWVLRTGPPWKDPPDRYPSPSTCRRRLKGWENRRFGSTFGEPSWSNWTRPEPWTGPKLSWTAASAQPRGARARSGGW
ncbi:MAG: transposase [Deltaproteobacteria bacterium]|nr:transposase [Deltaproteobacteria bacterium]